MLSIEAFLVCRFRVWTPLSPGSVFQNRLWCTKEQVSIPGNHSIYCVPETFNIRGIPLTYKEILQSHYVTLPLAASCKTGWKRSRYHTVMSQPANIKSEAEPVWPAQPCPGSDWLVLFVYSYCPCMLCHVCVCVRVLIRYDIIYVILYYDIVYNIMCYTMICIVHYAIVLCVYI